MLVMVMTFAFVVAPMNAAVDAAHLPDVSQSDCSDVEASEEDPADEPSHEGHEHRVHHCGGCHIHMLDGGDLSRAFGPPTHHKRLVRLQNEPADLGADGLYRPPRA
ncbi:MAG: hypothetical protein CME85_10310 [Henriciella sp.]|jgi:mono/diheme cytochrome c family protein|uniref:DUF2946 family protein n=1 Tax=Henriciella sp. TaxID=1968823 RepID=UPI000C0FEE3E|nr:hypothetical protein [Henriciella sp.]MBF33206.1 hypothetical protein [Hyphomonadaceae bacterium]MBK75873.1 hypothetical protein [Henriciella sp.]PHR80211.1 MAG: hypothetical protein COA64_04260 [Henriciella sp.]|tara:strand:+ start:462 stop:779 length:318 start_codon:yes stop_codon:yes gene_type:complete